MALVVSLVFAAGCFRGGALLGAVVGSSIITAAIVSSRPPPPPRVEYVVAAPGPGYVWQPGYWASHGGEWFWVEGRWIARHPGYAWAPAHWVEDPDRRWRLIPGQWVPAP